MSPIHLFLGLAGCTGESHEAHGDERGDAHEQEDGAHADEAHGEGHAALGELVVAPDVLRDLRITTRSAATTSGNERATVLGELTVDEDRYAEVGVPITARVSALHAAPGDAVEAGAPLVDLESAELGRARADLAIAQARLEQALRSAERKRELSGRAVSATELERAEADLSSAKADVAAAEASLGSYGAGSSTVGGATFTLRSPVTGVVLTRHAHRGEIVDPRRALFRVADLSELWLVVHAFERDALRANEGALVDVTFAALPNRIFHGTVARVGREVDPASRTVPIRIELDNAEGTLRPGMSATVRLPLGSGEGIVAVPAVAVQRCDVGWCVFVPKDEGHFEVRPVGRGRDLGGEVEILSGLNVGDAVVVDGAFLLRAEAMKQRGGGDEHHH
jgi:cobalt-zinc-cadmium efflux system membrane fusion protein